MKSAPDNPIYIHKHGGQIVQEWAKLFLKISALATLAVSQCHSTSGCNDEGLQLKFGGNLTFSLNEEKTDNIFYVSVAGKMRKLIVFSLIN